MGGNVVLGFFYSKMCVRASVQDLKKWKLKDVNSYNNSQVVCLPSLVLDLTIGYFLYFSFVITPAISDIRRWTVFSKAYFGTRKNLLV